MEIKVGDLIKYNYPGAASCHGSLIVMYVNVTGGTVKTLDHSGQIMWCVSSYCEVLCANR